jgi:hypothetical protein
MADSTEERTQEVLRTLKDLDKTIKASCDDYRENGKGCSGYPLEGMDTYWLNLFSDLGTEQ